MLHHQRRLDPYRNAKLASVPIQRLDPLVGDHWSELLPLYGPALLNVHESEHEPCYRSHVYVRKGRLRWIL